MNKKDKADKFLDAILKNMSDREYKNFISWLIWNLRIRLGAADNS